MGYIQGVSRQQTMLLPESVEDYVGADNPVRVIDAFVEGLDLAALGWTLVSEGSVGAPPYPPQMHLKLLLYGYLNRVRSSRDLKRATHRNLEVIWLLGGLKPDHWTIHDFRREHRTRFKAVFRQCNILCGGLGLFGGELVAIDGTFLKAVNHPSRNFTKAKVEQMLKEIDERTERYLETLEQADAEAPAQSLGDTGEPEQAKAVRLREQIAQLEQQRREHAEILTRLAAEPGTQLSLTDPDSRSLQKGHERVVGYNAQIAVDAAQHLIVVEEVTQEPNDSQMLAPMAEAARDALGVKELEAVGDRGYYNISQLQRCQEQGVIAYVPAPRPASVAGDGTYPDKSFRYEAQTDRFICPRGEALNRHQDTKKASGLYRVYYNLRACRSCPMRSACTRGAYRKLTVHEHAETVAAARQRLRGRPGILGQRKGLVEHPFGTLKFWMGYRAFLTRGLEMVRAEFSLSCLAYNLRRALNLLGVPALLDAMQVMSAPKATILEA